MIPSTIIEKAYRLTNKNEDTFMDGSATNVLAELNICYGHRVMDIDKVQTDINSFIHEEKTDLLSTVGMNEGDIGWNGEYPFDTEMMKPVRVEVSFDGTTWRKCKVYDLNENSSSEFNSDDINATFSETEPYVRFERNSFFVRPIKTSAGDITGGIHCWWTNRQDNMTTLGPDFEQNLHDILSYDLANLERIMHPDKYDTNWRNDFDITYRNLENKFNEYYKNRLKRDFVIRTKRESYN
jgi:hypothetical protein